MAENPGDMAMAPAHIPVIISQKRSIENGIIRPAILFLAWALQTEDFLRHLQRAHMALLWARPATALPACSRVNCVPEHVSAYAVAEILILDGTTGAGGMARQPVLVSLLG